MSTHTEAASATPANLAANPLLRAWEGPHGGIPPFDAVAVGHFRPALEAAMAEALAEVERIAADPSPPTFDNTLEALERAGRTLGRVHAIYGVWSTTMSDAAFQAVERDLAPMLAAHRDRIVQNTALFRRIEAVHDSPALAAATPEQRRLAWMYHTDFSRAGAALGDEDKVRLSAINQRLAVLSTTFAQNVLGDENEQFLTVGDEAELAGVPEPERAAAAEAATARGLDGRWVIPNTRSAVEPVLTYADRRDLRERAWRMFVRRGEGERDNGPVITEILALRAERARLLGYPTHAHWALEPTMAKTPERAMELMEAVWPAAVGRVAAEVAEMRELARAGGEALEIEPWDYRYYAEKVRERRYDLAPDEIEACLQLDRLRDGMFWVAGELFCLAFREADLPVYHPDVTAWEVTDGATGRHVGLFYFDPFARSGKKSGAWMNHYRRQDGLFGETPIVSNNCNYLKGRPGEPVLISWMDARTLFHEFGHALHGLLSSVTYRSLAGTRVTADYVEFPSQVLEHWLSTPEVLGRFAIHHRTGEPMSSALAERIERASAFNQGFATTEFLASAFLDMLLHLAADEPVDAAAFERDALAVLGMPPQIVMRHRLPHFAHIFSGDSYAVGYYSYLWADVLAADGFEAFEEAGGAFDPAVAARLRDEVLSRGNVVDPAEGYRAFRGADPSVAALMRKRGFAYETPSPGGASA